jgi:AraC-like DNA-binding protein
MTTNAMTGTTIHVLAEGDGGNAVLGGLTQHVRRHRLDWDLVPVTRALLERTTPVPGRQGILGRPQAVAGFLREEALLQALCTWEVPLVTCSRLAPDLPGVSRVVIDETALARMAARHLHERGYRRAAIWDRRPACRDPRMLAFATACDEAGLVCAGFDPGPEAGTSQQQRFCAFVREGRQHGPLAMFCTQDRIAAFVRELARLGGLQLPHDLALLGVDDQQDVCTAAEPYLSSVVIPWRAVGEAMGLELHRRLSGRPGGGTILLPPLRVAARASTGVAQVGDAGLARALTRLLAQPRRLWTAAQVATQAGAGSVRVLQTRLRRAGLPTFQKLLADARLDLAEEALLRGQSVAQAALAGGFTTRQGLLAACKRRHGLGPAAWRRRGG